MLNLSCIITLTHRFMEKCHSINMSNIAVNAHSLKCLDNETFSLFTTSNSYTYRICNSTKSIVHCWLSIIEIKTKSNEKNVIRDQH